MKIVKELMVPVDNYTRISAEASLMEAVRALDRAQVPGSDPERPSDRAVLVQDKDNRVIGKLSMWDILKGLEPRYDHPIDPLAMAASYGLWNQPLRNLTEKANRIQVKEAIRPFAEKEKIDEDDSLDHAVGQLVTGQFLSLLVLRDTEVTGILRLSDVFREVGNMMNEAQAETA